MIVAYHVYVRACMCVRLSWRVNLRQTGTLLNLQSAVNDKYA